MSKRKLKAARKGRENKMPIVHDRRAQQVPVNAMIRTITVDDPYEYGGRITAIASLRDDPLGRLHVRDQIDHAQYAAGRYWQGLYEEAEIGSIKAMDTTNEPVDGGGRSSELSTDRRRRAIKELAKAEHSLGRNDEALIRDLLVRRMSVEQIASYRGMSSETKYFLAKIVKSLEIMAKLFRFA